MSDVPDTLLLLDPNLVTIYSSRGMTHTLEPIDASFDVERSINGISYDLSQEQFRKYRGEISCSDIQSPAFGGLWPGRQVTMQSAQELPYLTADPGSKERPAVDGSERTEGSHSFYRPILQVRIGKWRQQFDEWNRAIGWTAPYEEV